MKHFMLWPMLVPAIAFCDDETVTAPAPSGIQYDIADDSSDVIVSDRPWVTNDHDDFLQKPWGTEVGGTGLEVDGTITLDGVGDDIYNSEYDMNDDN